MKFFHLIPIPQFTSFLYSISSDFSIHLDNEEFKKIVKIRYNFDYFDNDKIFLGKAVFHYTTPIFRPLEFGNKSVGDFINPTFFKCGKARLPVRFSINNHVRIKQVWYKGILEQKEYWIENVIKNWKKLIFHKDDYFDHLY